MKIRQQFKKAVAIAKRHNAALVLGNGLSDLGDTETEQLEHLRYAINRVTVSTMTDQARDELRKLAEKLE